MAIEVEAAGQVDEFFRVLKRRIWWILVPLCVIGSLGGFYAVVVPKKFVSRCEIMVRNLSEQSGEFGQNAAVEGQVASFNIRSHARIDGLLNRLQWSEYLALNDPEKYEFRRDKILNNLTVDLPPMPRNSGQQSVKMSFKSTDPERATSFLENLKEGWTADTLDRHRQEQEVKLTETEDRLETLNNELGELREAITNIRTQNSIPPSVSTLQGQVERRPRAYEERDETESRIRQLDESIRSAEDQFELKSAQRDILPPDDAVAYGGNDPLTIELNGLDDQISRAELEVENKGWAPGHSERRNAERLIQGLKLKRDRVRMELDDNRSSVQVVRPNSKRVELTEELRILEVQITLNSRRRQELEERLEQLEMETQSLDNAFKELGELTDNLVVAQTTKLALSSRVETLRVEVRTMRSDQGNPFVVLTAPTQPTRPTSPNPWAIGIGSILFGLGLGFGLAILLEYSKNCFRSPRELSRVIPHPVLGTVNLIRTRRERARAFLTRAALGGGSLAFVGMVTFITWAWSSDQQALNGEVVKAIDAFRRLLM
ncbi:MAG: hypothetical protein P8R46_13765 [Planctomycetota bacterium]|nr:hypothetical protein [Planctomycetota bacterium]